MKPRVRALLGLGAVLSALLVLVLQRGREVGAAARSSGMTAEPPPEHRVSAPHCIHDYVLTTVGTVLEYAWSSQGDAAEITLRLERAREHDGGATLVWSIETRSARGLQRATLERECSPDGAQEPWLGLGMPEVAALTGQDWRMPDSLAPGDRYGGTYMLSFASTRTTMIRSHDVEGAEIIEVDGVAHDTIRVSIADGTPGAAEPTRSVAWIERGLGLVRLDLAPGTPVAARYELRSIEIPDD